MNDLRFKYDFLKYNKYDVLRPNLALVLILFFLCKDFFMVLIVGTSMLKGRGGGGTSDLIAMVHPTFFFAAIPVIGVLYALGSRRPEAGRLPRVLWKNGRFMILLSVLLYLLILTSLRGYDPRGFSLLDWAVILINGGITFYVFSSQLIKDTFNQFPPAKADENPSTPVDK